MAPREAPVRPGAADRDLRRTRALREPRADRYSTRRGRTRLGNHLLDPPTCAVKQFRRRIVEIGHDACIERCLALRRRHLLQLRCRDDPRPHSPRIAPNNRGVSCTTSSGVADVRLRTPSDPRRTTLRASGPVLPAARSLGARSIPHPGGPKATSPFRRVSHRSHVPRGISPIRLRPA